MRVLIAGCGDTGSVLARLLVADGCEVWGVRRHPRRPLAGVQVIAADLTRPDALRGLPSDFDVVFYLVAAGKHDEDAYRGAYVDGVRCLAAHFGRARRFIFASSTSVYHQDDGTRVDESSPTEPVGFAGRVLLAGEAVARQVTEESTVVRLGGIYGPGRLWFVEMLRAGRLQIPRGRPVFTNRIHRDDAARALRHLALLDAPAGLYLGVDSEPADRAEVARWLARRFDLPMPVEVEPSQWAGRRHGGSKRCSNRRLLETGFALRYPSYREGYEAVLGGG